MVKIPVFDFICDECDYEFEYIVFGNSDIENNLIVCKGCGSPHIRQLCPQCAPDFRLKYDPKKDIVDWDGNTTQYYREYKKMKEEGKKPRIPALDGE